ELLYERPEALPESWRPDADRVQRIIAVARQQGRRLLDEAEAKELLAAYEMPVVPSVPCRTMEAAGQAAKQIGFPVVLKLLSTKVTHKSDVGGVLLNLPDESAVCSAYDSIRANVGKKASPDAFE